MLHLFKNSIGIHIAADTAAGAQACYDYYIGEEPPAAWTQLPDDQVIVTLDGEPPEKAGLTAAEWAAGFDAPMWAFSA